MSNIYMASSHENLPCLDLIKQELEAKGYTVLYEEQSLSLNSLLSAQSPEQAIISSIAIVLIWSGSAAQYKSIKQYLLFAHQLKKLIVPITLDSTALPADIDTVAAIQTTCTDTDVPTTVAQLLTLLPAANSTDPFIQICQQATHPHIAELKDAIDAAAALLKRNEHRDELLALLEYIANKDTFTSVRDKAQVLLDAEQKKTAPPSTQAKDMFPVVCPNKHTTYVNVRRLCAQPEQEVWRTYGNHAHANKKEREFLVKCDTQGCGEVMSVYIDCEGYR